MKFVRMWNGYHRIDCDVPEANLISNTVAKYLLHLAPEVLHLAVTNCFIEARTIRVVPFGSILVPESLFLSTVEDST